LTNNLLRPEQSVNLVNYIMVAQKTQQILVLSNIN